MPSPTMLSTVGTIAIILGTGVSFAGAVVALGRWAVTGLVERQLHLLTEQHLQPLAASMTRLSTTAESLANSLDEAKRAQLADHAASETRADEIHRAVLALERLVAEHETALRVHDTQIAALLQVTTPNAPVAIIRSTRSRRKT